MKRGERILVLAARLAAILFVIAALIGYAFLDRHAYPAPRDAVVMAAPAASACLLFLAAAALSPNLLSPGRIGFPLNLTLPIVYVLLLRVSVILWGSTSSAAFATFDPLRPALLWVQPLPLSAVALAQCAVLSAIAALGFR